MKLISRLKNILASYVNDQNKKEFNGPLIRKNFTDSLRYDPLISIDSLYFSYELNLRIIPWNEPNKWLVKNGEGDDFFSFTCKEEKKFIEVFEQKLIEKLMSHHSFNRNPPAGLDIHPK